MLNALQQTLAPFRGKARHFLILRISGVDKKVALKMANGGVSDYNRWLVRPDFVAVHRRIQELYTEHRDEALRLLRKENQLNAALMEAELVKEIRREIADGEYHLIKSAIAKELYLRLMSEMDKAPDVQVLTWEERIQQNQFFGTPPEQITEGESVEYEEV